MPKLREELIHPFEIIPIGKIPPGDTFQHNGATWVRLKTKELDNKRQEVLLRQCEEADVEGGTPYVFAAQLTNNGEWTHIGEVSLFLETFEVKRSHIAYSIVREREPWEM